MTPTPLQKFVFGLLTTQVGSAEGSNWERNQKKSIEDFMNEPQAIVNFDGLSRFHVHVSVFHFLSRLEQDDLCHKFNKLPCNKWDGQIMGTSKHQCSWLDKRGLKPVEDNWNTYNAESFLSQILQGQNLTFEDGGAPDYMLVQVHQGDDARAGYTEAKLFKVNTLAYLMEDVYLELPECNLIINPFEVVMVQGDDQYHENPTHLKSQRFIDLLKKYEGQKFETNLLDSLKIQS